MMHPLSDRMSQLTLDINTYDMCILLNGDEAGAFFHVETAGTSALFLSSMLLILQLLYCRNSGSTLIFVKRSIEEEVYQHFLFLFCDIHIFTSCCVGITLEGRRTSCARCGNHFRGRSVCNLHYVCVPRHATFEWVECTVN